MTQWVLVIMLVVSPGPNDWIKTIPMASEKACRAAVLSAGNFTTPFDNGRISLMCVETPATEVLR